MANILISKAKWFIQKGEMDQSVIYGGLAGIRGVILGPMTALLIAYYFTTELQGYYFTFNSLLALQVFADLGLGRVIVYFVSHEWAKLGLNEHNRIVGSSDALSRLVSLGRIGLTWYFIGGWIISIGLGICGYVFFSCSPNSNINWMEPWFALCLLTGTKLWTVPLFSLLEGSNQMSQVYFYRFIDGFGTGIVICLGIVFGAELWTPTISTLVSLVWSALFLLKRYRLFFLPFISSPNGPRISWRCELWPMQWRIAISWVSGYVIFSLFTPILFYYHGATLGGQMGMTWSIITTITAISTVWINVKTPMFGMLIANGEIKILDRLFYRITTISVLVLFLGAITVWLLVYFLYAYNIPFSQRILPPLSTGLFLLGHTLGIGIIGPLSVFLRAHKEEPCLWLSVNSAILVGLSTWILGKYFGATGMAFGYFLVSTIYSLPHGVYLWYSCRRKWGYI